MNNTMARETIDAVSYFRAKLEYEVGPYGVDNLLKDKSPVTIIDLRTPELYAKSHIPTAINVAYESLHKVLDQIERHDLIVVYCYNITCALATRAALYLSEQGYRVKELHGGFADYVQAGLKVEGKAEASSCSAGKSSTCA